MKVRPQSGFTLIETVVSLLLVALVLTLGVRLLRESQLVFLDIQAVAVEPNARLVEAILRADIHGARAVRRQLGSPQDIDGWTTGPLLLDSDDSRGISYRREAGQLVRSVASDLDGESGRRTVLKRVSGWQWRQLPGGVVEIRLLFKGARDPGSRTAGSRALRRSRDTRTNRLLVRFVMRDRPGRLSW